MTQSQTNDAASSPMLGKLIENKALPDGGWRATGAEEGCLTVTFENENLARNFAMRCAEKGYSATTPLSTIGGYWNVKVENMKNNNIEDKFYKSEKNNFAEDSYESKIYKKIEVELGYFRDLSKVLEYKIKEHLPLTGRNTANALKITLDKLLTLLEQAG